MDVVAETVCHGTLEGWSNILHTKGNYSIGECAPRGCECSLVMILFPNLDLVISRKAIHEGKDLMSGARINDLIDEACWEVVFGTCPIHITEFCIDANGSLFFINRNKI